MPEGREALKTKTNKIHESRECVCVMGTEGPVPGIFTCGRSLPGRMLLQGNTGCDGKTNDDHKTCGRLVLQAVA